MINPDDYEGMVQLGQQNATAQNQLAKQNMMAQMLRQGMQRPDGARATRFGGIMQALQGAGAGYMMNKAGQTQQGITDRNGQQNDMLLRMLRARQQQPQMPSGGEGLLPPRQRGLFGQNGMVPFPADEQ